MEGTRIINPISIRLAERKQLIFDASLLNSKNAHLCISYCFMLVLDNRLPSSLPAGPLMVVMRLSVHAALCVS